MGAFMGSTGFIVSSVRSMRKQIHIHSFSIVARFLRRNWQIMHIWCVANVIISILLSQHKCGMNDDDSGGGGDGGNGDGQRLKFIIFHLPFFHKVIMFQNQAILWRMCMLLWDSLFTSCHSMFKRFSTRMKIYIAYFWATHSTGDTLTGKMRSGTATKMRTTKKKEKNDGREKEAQIEITFTHTFRSSSHDDIHFMRCSLQSWWFQTVNVRQTI